MVTVLLINSGIAAQVTGKEPEHELALGIKTVTRKIIFGPNEFYITDPGSVTLQPFSIRYDYPLKISGQKKRQQYVSLTGQAGFLFGKAKKIDLLYFNPKNPAYFTLSAGLYTISSFSIGTEVFFWKGLGNRDLLGARFLSAGYNGKNFRLYASGEYYMQLLNTSNNGILFSIDFLWKLVKGGADKKRKG